MSAIRVLYSFPHRIGAGRICSTAYHQVCGLAGAGSSVTVLSGSAAKALPPGVRLLKTLALGDLRVPARIVGRGTTCAVHDWVTAKWLQRNGGNIDVVHCWPLASIRTLRVAKQLGIPTFIERPNTHTAYAYEAAAEENRLLGVALPGNHDHEFNGTYLAKEEEEYEAADYLLCPSEFVARTFFDRGYTGEKIRRHHYGYDPARFLPGSQDAYEDRGLVMLYAGVCEPRKGLHYALDAWLSSTAHRRGKFIVCGDFVPGYREKLAERLSHPSIEFLGHRSDLPELMAKADVFALSSVEEGSALVTYEARAAGCVLLVSDGSGAVCQHGHDALVHPMRDVAALTKHLDQVDSDRAFLSKLRAASLSTIGGIDWAGAGTCLARLYSESIEARHPAPLSA